MGILNGFLSRCQTIYMAEHVSTYTTVRPSTREMQSSRYDRALGASQLLDSTGY